MNRVKIKPIVFASTIVIVGGIASIPLGFSIAITIALVSIGTIGNLWWLLYSEKTIDDLQALIDTQIGLFSTNRTGNVYLEKLKKDLKNKGRTINFHEYINKALKTDPDNPDVITFYTKWAAYWLSHCQRFKFVSELHIKNESDRLVTIIKKAIKQNPNYFELREVLGVVFDIQGKHLDARDEFYEVSKYREDPYWLFLVATSWLMEKRFDKALECIETAIAKGAKGYLVDYYYGGALQSNGRYQEAYKYLRRAYKVKLSRAEEVEEIYQNFRMQCKFISASRYAFILFLLKIKYSFKESLKTLYAALFHLFLGLFTGLLRLVVSGINTLKFPRIITRKINIISQPHAAISEMLIKRGHYEQAEIIISKVVHFDSAQILNQLAILRTYQDKINESIEILNRAIKLHKRDNILRLNRDRLINIQQNAT